MIKKFRSGIKLTGFAKINNLFKDNTINNVYLFNFSIKDFIILLIVQLNIFTPVGIATHILLKFFLLNEFLFII